MARNDGVDLLPEGESLAADNGQEVNLENLSLNFSEEEAGSEARDFQPIPTGKYAVAIFDGEVRFSTSSKNNGKPYWALQLRITEGPYANRRLFTNVMLFEGALYSLSQLLKALGHEVGGTTKVPTLPEIIGKEILVSVVKQVDKYKIEQGEWDASSGEPKPMKNEVKSFFKPGGATGTAATAGKGSLLP